MTSPNVTDLEQERLERFYRKEHVKHLADARLGKHLCDATMACVAARGFADTTTHHVAQHANVSTGTLFRLYPTKTLLLQAAMREAESLLRRSEPAHDDDLRGHTFQDQLWDLWFRATANARAHPNAFHYWRLYRVTPLDTEWGFPEQMRLGPFNWLPVMMAQAKGYGAWNDVDGWLAASQWAAAMLFVLAPARPSRHLLPGPHPVLDWGDVMAHAFMAFWKGLSLDMHLPRVSTGAYI